LGQISAIDLLKHQQKGDNISGLEIMANGTPEVFPLRGNAKKIEDTWVRGTTNNKMVPESLSSPPAAPAKAALIQLEKGDNISGLEIMANGTPEVFPLRGHPTAIESTWVRGTTNNKMVPESLSSPPAAPAKEAAPAKAANVQLEDNTGKWAGYNGPSDKTWIRSTTDAAMVTEPPIPKAANVQLEDNAGKWGAYTGPIEDTWIRSTTDAAMVTEPPVPKIKAPADAANI